MPNILHLSDTTLSGSPIRISRLINKHSKNYRSRHIVWQSVIHKRVFATDLVGQTMSRDEIMDRIGWADIIHYHNRWQRQELFKHLGVPPPNKPSLIQIHSPRQSEDFRQEIESGLPLAVVAQYHPREWKELSYIVPNVVDITEPEYAPSQKRTHQVPLVSYAPSNCNARGWDDKGYGLVVPHLKRLSLAGKIMFKRIIEQPHDITLQLKRAADIGIDEIATGSYHLSSLEYMAMGTACFARLDGYTAKVVKDLTGSEDLPWIQADRDSFVSKLMFIVESQAWPELGLKTRKWMETYWNPQALVRHYEEMYTDILSEED